MSNVTINLSPTKCYSLTGSLLPTFKLAGIVISIYKSLRFLGMGHEISKKLTSKIAWFIYNDLTSYSWKLTRLISRKNMNRVRHLMKFYINVFPYKRPGYQMRILKTEADIWNVVLLRTEILAKGDNLCNFKYRVSDNETAAVTVMHLPDKIKQ